MNSNDCHLRPVLIDEEAVGNQLGDVRFDKRGQVFHGNLELFESSLANHRGVDVHDWLMHHAPFVEGGIRPHHQVRLNKRIQSKSTSVYVLEGTTRPRDTA